MATAPKGTEKVSIHFLPEQVVWLRDRAAAIQSQSLSVIARQAVQAAMDAEKEQHKGKAE